MAYNYLSNTDEVTTTSGDNKTLVSGVSNTIIVPKASGNGIKVDIDDPTFGWQDMLGPIHIRGSGGTDPAFNLFTTSVRAHQFAVNDEVFVPYHITHDCVPGGDLYIHTHWAQNKTTKAGAASGNVTGGTVTWGLKVTYAKGHQQAAFSSEITTTVQQTCNSTVRWHHIAEVQLSAASPSASQLDSDNIEVDGLILTTIYLSANAITVDAGSVPAPFLLYADIHYQSTGIGTKSKAPDFYSS